MTSFLCTSPSPSFLATPTMAEEGFQVVVSCRPSEATERAWKLSSNSLQRGGNGSDAASYEFSHVFAPGTSHSELYERAISPFVAEALAGSNVAVVAYGVPQTGKSRAVFGTSGQTRVKEEARGVIIRCGKQLFDTLEREDFSPSVSRITATFFHVFEDGRVADLFDTKKRNLEFLEDKENLSYSIPNLTEHVIASPHDVLRLAEKGCLMRNATGCVKDAPDIKNKKVKFAMYSNMSAPSPQPMQQYRKHCSHAVFVFTIEHSNKDGVTTLSRITVVDLAGRSVEQLYSNSPCVDTGMKTLHKIITTLPKHGIVAAASLFSKSSLSKALKPCFGGNCKTVLIGTISLAPSSSEATSKCLELLTAARGVKNFSKSITTERSETKMGRCLEDIQSLKENVTQRLKIAPVSDSAPWQVIGGTAVRIDGTLYEDLCSSEQDLLRTISDTEAQLIRGGRSSEEQQSVQKLSRSVSPLAMHRPSTRPALANIAMPATASSSSSSSKPLPSSPAGAAGGGGGGGSRGRAAPSPLLVSVSAKDKLVKTERPTPHADDRASITSASSLETVSVSSTDTDDEPITPTITGPAPPPLRGIPHIKPDPQPMTITAPIHVLSKPPRPPHTPPNPELLPPAAAAAAAAAAASEPHVPPNTSSSPPLATQIVVAPSFPTSARRSLFQDTNTVDGPIPAATTRYMAPVAKPVIVTPLSLPRQPPVGSAPAHHPRTVSPPVVVASSPIGHSPPVQGNVSPAFPSNTSPSFPAVNLSPIRPIPPPLTQRIKPHPLLPAAAAAAVPPPAAKHPSTGESSEDDMSSSSSDSSIKLTSDSDMEDEARDQFDPNLQQRRLLLQPLQPYMASSANAVVNGGITRLPILPPISSPHTPSSPLPLPTVTTQFIIPQQQPHAQQWRAISGFNQPPTYQQAASSDIRQPDSSPQGSPPDYTERQQAGAATTGSPPDPVDLTQYMSSEEIHMAATEGVKSSTMKKLAIKFGVDYRDHGGRTPLMYAILGNQPKMCEVLVKLGASINAKDSTGLTPLLWATYLAKHDVMKVLLRNGADVQCTDQSGRNPYHWAMKSPIIQCLKWLTKYADSQAVNHRDKEGLSPLHMAVMCGQASHVRLLLSSTCADVSVLDKEGRTPLNYAVLNYSTSCIRAILDCSEGAVSVADSRGRMVLHYACAEGNADCVRTLLTYRSCDPHCTDGKGTTPLHWAAAANQPSIIQLLLRRGADRVYRDNEDMTPLDYAQQRGHSDCVRILQTYGLRRPLSAVSVHSHAGGLPPSSSQALDEHGHIVQHKPSRRFSLSGVSLSSIDRLPADGQAQSESTSEENASANEVDSSQQEGRDSADVVCTPDSNEGEGSHQPGRTEPGDSARRRRRRRQRFAALCGCNQSNVVVPANV